MRRGPSPWTEECIALLKTMRAQGHSCLRIARALNHAAGGTVFSRNAVIAKCDRLKLPVPEHLKANRDSQARKIANKRKHADAKPRPLRERHVVREDRFPEASEISPTFIETRSGQCKMFCRGESGSNGRVCGMPVEHGRAWCAACAALVYYPGEKRRPQKRRRAA